MTTPDSGLPVGLGEHAAARTLRSLESLSASLPGGLTSRLLVPADAGAMRALRADVVASLSDPDHYRLDGEVGDFVADHLGRCGLTAGLFFEGRLVAYGALGLPGPHDPNRGRDLPLADAELGSVAHMASCMVRPEFRSLGLHHRLIDWRLDMATQLGRRHVLTTVSPRNFRSCGHLAAHGIYPKRIIRVAGGLDRLLVHRDAEEVPVPDPATLELCAPERLAADDGPLARGSWVWARGLAYGGGMPAGDGAGAVAICARPFPVRS